MSLVLNEINCSADQQLFINLKENLSTYWHGKEISVQDATTLYEAFQDAIARLIFSKDQQGQAIESILSKFCHHQDVNFAFADRVIEPLYIELNNPHYQDLIKSAGLGKVWRKHKKEIIIGAIAVAVIVTVTAVVIATYGAGSSAAAATGASALGGAQVSLDKNRKKKEEAITESIETQEPPQEATPPLQASLPEIPAPVFNQPLFTEEGVFLKDEYYSYWQFLQKANQEEFLQNLISRPSANSPESLEISDEVDISYTPRPPQPGNSLTRQYFDILGREVIGQEFMADAAPSMLQQSHVFETDGKRNATCRIGGINGINTSLDYASGHANYLKELTQGQNIDWVYNNSHGVIADLALEIPLNYGGISPNTANLLTENWTAFHQENKNNPQAKYLQFCHSQGAIHVRNALDQAPQEIKDRIIVVAIAPGAVISKKICYQSYNYASKKDPVPHGEMFFAGLNEPEIRKELVKEVVERRKELILLDPHPNASGLDHDFQSPTFKSYIYEHLDEYISKSGLYE